MAVLTDAISVLVRVRDIEEVYPGGLEAYISDAPNQTYCSDGLLSRVGFMNPADVQIFTERLRAAGLRLDDSDASQVAIVDQMTGPTRNWTWVETTVFQRVIRVARLSGDDQDFFAAPDYWEPSYSLELAENFFPLEELGKTLHKAGFEEDGIDLYFDEIEGQIKFHGRAFGFPPA
jgi:hypothetical protein